MLKKAKKIKRPSKELKAKFEPLIEACTKAIALSPDVISNDNGKICVIVTWSLDGKGKVVGRPDTFPKGLSLGSTDKIRRIKYEAKKLLTWFKENKYINYDSYDIVEQRTSAFSFLNKLNKLLDFDSTIVYNCISSEKE